MPQRTYGVKEEEKTAFTEKKKEKEHAKKLSERERVTKEIDELNRKIEAHQSAPRGFGFQQEENQLYQQLQAKADQLSSIEEQVEEVETEYTETYTDYTLIEMPPPEVQRYIETLDPAQRKVIDRVLEEHGYDSDQFRSTAQQVNAKLPTGESIPLGQIVKDISIKEIERETRLGNLYDRMYQYGDNLLKGKLPDLPQETIDIFNKQVEEAYAPEFAALGLSEERQRNLIKEQGVQALNQINEMRIQAESIFKVEGEKARAAIGEEGVKTEALIREEGITALSKLREHTLKERTRLQGLRAGVEARREEFVRSNQQRMLDLAASTGRSPMDPTFQREAAQIIGKEFAAQEAELGALEQGIGEQAAEGEKGLDELTRTRLLGLSRQIMEMERGVGSLQRERILGAGQLQQEQTLGAGRFQREQETGLSRGAEAARLALTAQRGATRAGQLFNARTALPTAGFASQLQASGLFNAQQTQDLANQFSMFQGAGGLAAPLLQERLAQPTETQYQSPLAGFMQGLQGLGGAAYGAGSIIGGLGKT